MTRVSELREHLERISSSGDSIEKTNVLNERGDRD
jgi:hypothetical protein